MCYVDSPAGSPVVAAGSRASVHPASEELCVTMLTVLLTVSLLRQKSSTGVHPVSEEL